MAHFNSNIPYTSTDSTSFDFLDEDNELGLASVDPETGEYDAVEVELDVEYTSDAPIKATSIDPAEGGVQDFVVMLDGINVTPLLSAKTLADIQERLDAEDSSDDGYRD